MTYLPQPVDNLTPTLLLTQTTVKMTSWTSNEGMQRLEFVLICVTDSVSELAPLRRSRRLAADDDMDARGERTTPVPVLDGAHSQDQAPFLKRLPAELRRMIYTFAQGAKWVHIRTNHRHRLQDIRAALPSKAKLSEPSCSYCEEDSAGHGSWRYNPTKVCVCQPLDILGLSLTCRLLYAETIPLLYGSRGFLFSRRDEFLHFCEGLHANRPFTVSPLSHLKHIQLYFPWPFRTEKAEVKEMEAAMTLLADQAVSLKRFGVNVSRRGTSGKLRSGHKLLYRNSLWVLGRFRGLEGFDLPFAHEPFYSSPEALKGRSVLEQCLRSLVYQPQGSKRLSKTQFGKQFEKMYQALMADGEDGSQKTQQQCLELGAAWTGA